MRLLKRMEAMFLIVAMVVSLLVAIPASATDESPAIWSGKTLNSILAGSGTASDPYQISTAEGLAFLADAVRNGNALYNDKYYVLTNDIYLNNISNYENWGTSAPANLWKPIGDVSNPFKGTFDGMGHTVYGMYINSPSEACVGFFANAKGTSSARACIKNLNLSHAMIVGPTEKSNFRVGGLCGVVDYLTIENCVVDAKIVVTVNKGAESGIGGIAGRGENSLTVKKSAFLGSITLNQSANGPDRVGGIVGISIGLTLDECYSSAAITVSGTGTNAGGLVGYGNGGFTLVQNCGYSGSLTALTDTGSLGGLFGTVSAAATAGNLIQSGTVSTSDTSNVGAVCGTCGGTLTVTNCYYNQGSGLSAGAAAGATGLAQASMVSENMGGLSASGVWNMNTGALPTLKNLSSISDPAATYSIWTGTSAAAPSLNGSGTEADPYRISTAEELAFLAERINADDSKYRGAKIYYQLTADIYLNDVSDYESWTKETVGLNEWIPIGNTEGKWFSGIFDGKGHTVYGMFISNANQNYIGLFGDVHTGSSENDTTTGIVKNLNVEKSFIGTVGISKNAGGIAGRAARGAQIINCVTDVRINISTMADTATVGGVVGKTAHGATIQNCANLGDISVTSTNGGGAVGGILGYTLGSITATVKECYNAGSIYLNKGAGVGGIVGDVTNSAGTVVTDCYNIGYVSRSSEGQNCGGIVGLIRHESDKLINCFNNGAVFSDRQLVGGRMESYSATFTNCYYNKDLGTGEYASSGTALTGGQFVSENFTGLSGDIWILENGKMPVLKNTYQPAAQTEIWNGTDLSIPAGAGTAENPWTISTPAELAFVARVINDKITAYYASKAYYKLANDIYLNDVTDFSEWSSSDSRNEWSPIAKFDTSYFRGVFDGNGHTVYGMFITAANEYNGFIGSLHAETTAGAGVVKNLTVDKSAIYTLSSKGYAGGIVGRAAKKASISDCTSKVNIQINSGETLAYAGGILGFAFIDADVTACVNYGTITLETTNTRSAAGGIVGCNTQSTAAGVTDSFIGCVNYGAILMSSGIGVGGIVGFTGETSRKALIEDCVNYGSVTAQNENTSAGGIVGRARFDTNLEDCINFGAVSSDGYVAGLIGSAYGANLNLTKCYDVSATNSLVGDFASSVEGASFTKTVSGCDVITIENGAKIREKYTRFMDGDTLVAEGQGLLFGGSLCALPLIDTTEEKVIDGYSVGIQLSYGSTVLDVPANVTLSYCEETQTLDFTAHLIGIDEENFNTEITAKVYLKSGDDKLLFSAPVVRSVQSVALLNGGALDANGNFVDYAAENAEALAECQTNNKASYTAVSFNLLYSTGESGDPTVRLAGAKSAILTKSPDSFGVQECQSGTYVNDGTGWYELLTKDSEITSVYAYVGEANDDGYNNFYNLIFYRKDKFDLLDSGTLWLSDTPNVPYSTYVIQENDQERIVTYAKLKDKTTGEIYTHFNTHLAITRSAMQKQLVALKAITDACETPFVLTGDFNLNTTWSEYLTVLSNWKDARLIAPTTCNDPTNGSQIIDYCLVSDGVCVKEYGVIKTDGSMNFSNVAGEANFISDHYPIFTTFSLCEND